MRDRCCARYPGGICPFHENVAEERAERRQGPGQHDADDHPDEGWSLPVDYLPGY